jgi:hypothetical protein
MSGLFIVYCGLHPLYLQIEARKVVVQVYALTETCRTNLYDINSCAHVPIHPLAPQNKNSAFELILFVYMRAIWKVTLSELLTIQAMRTKIFIMYKNINILKLLLNIVTTEIEALVLSGNKFLYACVKEVCHLLAQPHLLLQNTTLLAALISPQATTTCLPI